MPEPWDRQPKEPGDAYHAFCAYRDMGPERNVVDAFRQTTGNPSANQANGSWNRWATQFQWRARAMSWDHHTSAVAQESIDRVTRETASKWAQRLDARAEVDWQVAENLTRKVQVWSALPAVSRTKLPDGTLVEAVGIQDTERVAKIAQAASQMAYAAIAQALPDAHVDFDPHTAPLDQLAEAIERLEAAIGEAPARPRVARAG